MNYRVFLITLLLGSTIAFSLVLHPDGEPDETWQDRPSDAVAARIGACSGTVIHSQYILTVAHFSMTLETSIEVNGEIYYPEEIHTHPIQDIRLIKVADADFQSFAALPDDSLDLTDENTVTVINGWGKSRGNKVYAVTEPNAIVGYEWSASHGTLKWGTSKILNHNEKSIYTRFESNHHEKGTPHECALATYDSGCGMFLRQNDTWIFAAIGRKVTDPGYGFFRNPFDANEDYGTLNTFLQTQPFHGWIKSIIYGPDITEDGHVNMADLIQFHTEWLCQDDNYNYRADLNRDGIVNGLDFALLASKWTTEVAPGDITGNGTVDFEDATILMSQWLGEPGDPSADIAPDEKDGQVNLQDFAQLARDWSG